MSIEIIEVTTKKQLKQFIDFPHFLYKDNPNYVPALFLAEKWVFGNKNPFFKKSKIQQFLAMDNKKVVGRITAIYNRTHLEVYNDNTGFFGFFDSINNQEVANLLLKSASDWLKKNGLSKMMGPANLTTNNALGVLSKGFDLKPMVEMPYNFEYYNNLLLKNGMKKEMELYAYEIDGVPVVEKYKNVLNRSFENSKKTGIKIRSLSSKNFDQDIEKLRKVYNRSNENNWGFMPLNEDEFKEMAYDLKRVTPMDLAIVAEKDDQFIGFIIAVPDINQSLQHIRKGRLFPFGFFRLLLGKKKVTQARIMILGLLDDYKRNGLDLLLYSKIKSALNDRNIFIAEASYVMKSNTTMNNILKKIEGKITKEYTVYSAGIIDG